MIIDNTLLQRLGKRFGIYPISDLDPQLQGLLKSGTDNFIKAPAGFEPNITGGGYEWDDSLNGYRLGQNQKIFLLPNGMAIWVFKDVLARALGPDNIAKWVSGDAEYPMGKANAFFIVYGRLTGQDLGQNETAGDNVPDGETEPGDGGGVAAPAESGAPFSKADIQKMLKGGWPSDVPSGPKNSMQSSIPKNPADRMAAAGDEPEVDMPSGPVPDRSQTGNPPPPESEADQIIKALYAKAKVNPKAKLSKQNPIRIDGDEIIDLYQKAKQMPPEEGKKLIDFLKSGAIKPLEEGKISKNQLQSLLEHIVQAVMSEVDKAKKKAKDKKKTPSKPNPDSMRRREDDDDSPRIPSSPTLNYGGGDVDWESPQVPHSQMDWDAAGEERPRYGKSQEDPYRKWIEQLANQLWKDPNEIGKNQFAWRVDQVKKHPSATVYMVKKSKRVESSRIFANKNGKWFYFNPDADVQDRKWKPVEATPPGEEPSIEQEQTGTAAVAPVTGPNAFAKKNKPLEEMTTTDGGTPGYNIPGAFSRRGGSKSGVAGSEKLGYKLTSIGKQDMEVKGDNLY